MKKFKVGDKALVRVGTRVKFYKEDINKDSYFCKNLAINDEVEIVKVEKADKSVGGCSYFIKINIDNKEYFSSESVPNNKFLPQELREMLEEARRELKNK